MHPWRARRERNELGSAVVDFVMVLIILLPMFAALLQLSLVLHVRNTLSSAAAEGARRAAVSGATLSDGRARTTEQILGSLNEKYAAGVGIQDTTIAGAPAVEVKIRAEVPALGLGGPAIAFTVSGTAIREDAP